MMSTIKKSVFKVIKSNIWTIILLVFVICGVVVLSLIPPQILKNIIDQSLVPKKFDKLLTFAFAYIGILFLIGVFNFFKEAIITILGLKITKEIRSEMIKKLERINAMFFSTNSSGTVVSRFTNDVDAINSLFPSGIVGMIQQEPLCKS